MRVLALGDATRTQTDVTEGVRVLYDNVINSLDWGSRFLSNEEAMQILQVAVACGFEIPANAGAMFESYASQTTAPPPPCVACNQPIEFARRFSPHPGWRHVEPPAFGHKPMLWPGHVPEQVAE